MASSSSLSPGQALARWALQVFVFVLAGGVAAGASTIIYEWISQADNPVGLYSVIFAAGGIIAYRLTERVLDGD